MLLFIIDLLLKNTVSNIKNLLNVLHLNPSLQHDYILIQNLSWMRDIIVLIIEKSKAK